MELPPALSNCDIKQKRAFLEFKRHHTEIEWEQELLKQQEILQKKADLERLKQMTQGSSYKNQVVEPVRKKTTKVCYMKHKISEICYYRSFCMQASRSDDENEDYSTDDDLFNEDEVELFSSKFTSDKETSKSVESKREKASTITRKRIQSNKKQKIEESEEEEPDDDDEEEEEENDDRSLHLDESVSEDGSRESDDSPTATYEECLKLQMRRNQIERLITEPYCEDALKNTFVRLSLGMSNGVAVYLMAEIVAVKDSFKPYMLENGKQTQIRLDLAVGKSTKRFRISLISNRLDTVSIYINSMYIY